jgi:O-antigen/teichoic acid export membrane protein
LIFWKADLFGGMTCMDVKEVKKASSFYLIGTLFNKGMSFLTVPLFTRILSTTDYGIITTYYSWVSILGMILGFALHMGIRAACIDFKKEIDEFTATIFMFTTIICSGVTIIVIGGITFIGINVNIAMVLMCMIHSFAAAIIQDFSQYLMMHYRYKFRTAVMVLPNLISVIISAFAIVFVLKSDLYMGRIIPTALVNFAFSIIMLYLVFKKSERLFNFKYLKYGLAISAPLIVHGIALNILSQSDRTMITWLSDASQTGIYSLIYNFSMIATVITTAMEGIWVPWFMKKMEERKIKEINKMAKDYVDFMTYAMVCIVLVGPEVVKLLASKPYWQGINIIPPIVLANYIIFLYTLYVNVEHFHKKTPYITINTVIAAISNLILNYIFIPRFGYVAAANTTIFSYVLSLILHSRYTKKLEPEIYPIKTFISPILHILLGSVAFYVLIDYPIARWLTMFLYLTIIFFRERKRILVFFPVIQKSYLGKGN